jgi:hypothetical protein
MLVAWLYPVDLAPGWVVRYGVNGTTLGSCSKLAVLCVVVQTCMHNISPGGFFSARDCD